MAGRAPERRVPQGAMEAVGAAASPASPYWKMPGQASPKAPLPYLQAVLSCA